jgi:two-component system, response regulator PdtaR
MGEQKKILLVENERIIALDIKNILEQSNYIVLDIVFNSSLIISYVSKQKPDIIITGVKGNPNFPALLRRITGDYRIPVLILTGTPETQLSEIKKIRGCTFLRKPYDHNQLITAVEESLLISL